MANARRAGATTPGIGKREMLKYVLGGCWPRRITQEHRLVDKVGETRNGVLQARYPY